MKKILIVLLFAMLMVSTFGNNALFDQKVSLISAATGQQAFQLDISLFNHPNASAKQLYEEVLQQFSYAVYEMSNGGHIIQTINIYMDGYHGLDADIVWVDELFKSFAKPGGILNKSEKIYIADTLSYGVDTNGVPGTPVDYLNGSAETRRQLGYILAHEFGHYAYVLYDEYVGSATSSTEPGIALATDTPVNNSVMNNQWLAVGGDFNWLNMSTPGNYESDTAQGRVWEESAWDLLDNSLAQNPLPANISSENGYIFYEAFNPTYSRAPSIIDGWIKRELDANGEHPDAANVNFRWYNNKVEMDLVIDISGSMAGDPLANVKMAAHNFVDIIDIDRQTGTNYPSLGITTFDHVVNANYMNLSEITPLYNLTPVHALIDGLTDGGYTAMYDAAVASCNKLNNYSTTTNEIGFKLAFLLSDGQDNRSGNTPGSVTVLFQNSNIPLHTLGYGYINPVLNTLAEDTGGFHHVNLVGADAVTAAFTSAFEYAKNNIEIPPDLSDVSAPIVPYISFVVDYTDNAIPYLQAEIEITYNISTPVSTDNPGGFTVHNPDDYATDLITTMPDNIKIINRSTGGSGYVTRLILNEAALNSTTGGGDTWRIAFPPGQLTSVTATVNLVPEARVFEAAVDVAENEIVYPEPIVIKASVWKDLPITGVLMNAILIAPSGAETPIVLNDAGENGDTLAGDGIYSALFADYTENGNYILELIVDNTANTGEYTFGYGSLASDGSHLVPPNVPVNSAFLRKQTIALSISGVVPDDGNNDYASATVINADDTLHPGKIEHADDLDFYNITGVDVNNDLVIRISNIGFGFVPQVIVYNSSTLDILAYVNDDSVASGDSYFNLRIAADELTSNCYAIVGDMYGNTGGTYSISAGVANTNDVVEPVQAVPVEVSIEPQLIDLNYTPPKVKIEMRIPNTYEREDVDKSTLVKIVTESSEMFALDECKVLSGAIVNYECVKIVAYFDGPQFMSLLPNEAGTYQLYSTAKLVNGVAISGGDTITFRD
jgi:hypothetical protein